MSVCLCMCKEDREDLDMCVCVCVRKREGLDMCVSGWTMCVCECVSVCVCVCVNPSDLGRLLPCCNRVFSDVSSKTEHEKCSQFKEVKMYRRVRGFRITNRYHP